MDVVEQQETVKKYCFTVEEFHKTGEAGIFTEDDRVELIDGEVVQRSPIGWRHVWCVRRLIRILARLAEEWTARGNNRYEVAVQDPFVLSEYGEPQPDLVLLKDPPIGRLPGPEEVVLVAEVADTSLAYDRNVKLARYAPGPASPRRGWRTSLGTASRSTPTPAQTATARPSATGAASGSSPPRLRARPSTQTRCSLRENPNRASNEKGPEHKAPAQKVPR